MNNGSNCHTNTDTFITLSAWWLHGWTGFRYVWVLGRWVSLDWGGSRWRWSVLKGLEVVYHVISYQCTAAKCPPVNNSDGERRVEVFVFWQLLKDNRVAIKHREIAKKKPKKTKHCRHQWHRTTANTFITPISVDMIWNMLLKIYSIPGIKYISTMRSNRDLTSSIESTSTGKFGLDLYFWMTEERSVLPAHSINTWTTKGRLISLVAAFFRHTWSFENSCPLERV